MRRRGCGTIAPGIAGVCTVGVIVTAGIGFIGAGDRPLTMRWADARRVPAVGAGPPEPADAMMARDVVHAAATDAHVAAGTLGIAAFPGAVPRRQPAP